MSNFKVVISFIIIALIMISGCGPSTKDVKKGDIVITEEVLRERAETQWEDNFTDGFITEIPKGTKLEVLFTPTPAAKVFECRPIEVNGEKDPDMVEAFFVPEPIKNKIGYKSYSFALKKEYLGTKVKKLESKN